MALPLSRALAVLAYDRVVSGASFAHQMERLLERHAVVSVGRVLDALEGGHSLPPGAVLLAFHEPRSFREHAWPVLRAHGLAALLFVPAGEPSAGAPIAPELRELAAAGVALGLALGDPESRVDLRRVFAALEDAAPGLARVLAHAPGAPGERAIARARQAGVELALTTLRGSNDLGGVDPLRLRRLPLEESTPVEDLERLGRVQDPLDSAERRSRRVARRLRRRARFLHRPLDAFLTAALPSSGSTRSPAATGRGSHYERLRGLVRRLSAPSLGIDRRLRRGLLDARRLGLRERAVALVGYGSAATVFGLGAPGERGGHVLKVYRWTLGLPPWRLAQIARRHRARHRQLCAWFGSAVLPAHYLVLNAPLRGLAAVVGVQERIASSSELFARTDAELLALLRDRPALAAEFAAFARRVLELHGRGFFPDLIGAGNLLVVERPSGACLRLIDYGLFDLRGDPTPAPRAAIEAATRRLAALLRDLGSATPVEMA